MKCHVFLVLASLAIFGCDSHKKVQLTAQMIVDKAIESSGKEKLNHSTLSFEFRGRTYESQGECEGIVLHRISKRAGNVMKETFDPSSGFKRFINDSLVSVADTTATKIKEAINSVHYFVQLPYRLNDDAVQKKYIGLDTIKDKVYHNIEISFQENGGGTDFQDVYLYWFEKDNFKLDYLAYSFVVNGGGLRFREAFNERYIEGIRFVDYKNYKPKNENIKLEEISDAYNHQELELLSEIKNKNIEVEVMDIDC